MVEKGGTEAISNENIADNKNIVKEVHTDSEEEVEKVNPEKEKLWKKIEALLEEYYLSNF